MHKKLIFFVIVVLYGCFVFADEPNVNICLTGKLENSLPIYKSFVNNAATLAWEDNGADKHIHIDYYFFDNKPLSAIHAYDQMMAGHCSAIIGYEYLSDLLLVAKQQYAARIPIFTSYASSLTNETLPSNIFMFMPYYDTTSNIMIKFLKARFHRIDNALIITEIDRPDLVRYKIAYSKLLREDKVHYNSFDCLQNDTNLERNLRAFIKNKSYHFVFVLTGAVGATKVLNLMNDHKAIFIGTENFGSSTNQSVFLRLNDKLIRAFTIRNIDFLTKTPAMMFFENHYKNRFGVGASPLSMYTYDAMDIIIGSFKRYKKIDAKRILRLNKYGVTGAKVYKGRLYRSNQFAILSIAKNGFALCSQS